MTDSVLTSKDGKFICTAEHAVEIAQMISNAEGALMRPHGDLYDITALIGRYIDGDMSVEQVNAELAEWAKEDEAQA